MARTSDQALSLLRNRDESFLVELFKEINPYLHKILCGYHVSKESSQDLIQATWEVFLKNLDKFEGRSQIKVFLAGILLNKIREDRRVLKRFAPEEDIEKITNSAFTIEGWWKLDPVDPQTLMQSKQALEFIEECIEGLSEAQKNAFILREIEDEDTENICKILGISVSNLGVLIFRAKEKLRSCLEGQLLKGPI